MRHRLDALVLGDLHPIVERSLSSNAALSVPLVVITAAAGILSEPRSQLSCVDAAKGISNHPSLIGPFKVFVVLTGFNDFIENPHNHLVTPVIRQFVIVQVTNEIF